MKKKYATNADRQRAYRQRNRNAGKGTVTRIGAKKASVTKADPRDRCGRYLYICESLGLDLYAKVVSNALCASGTCPLCDAER